MLFSFFRFGLFCIWLYFNFFFFFFFFFNDTATTEIYTLSLHDAFPLSDHADFPSLMRYAKASGARRVLTVHGYARELAGHLRREGIRAEPLVEQEQLELL